MPGRDNSILAVCDLIFDRAFIVGRGLNCRLALIFERDERRRRSRFGRRAPGEDGAQRNGEREKRWSIVFHWCL